MIILVTGIAGSGKTTVGRLLAQSLGWPFADADEFHPPANIAKMASGTPLDETDRVPWLAALRAHIDAHLRAGTNAVVTCSAPRQSHREALIADPRTVKLVYLRGTPEQLHARLSARTGHFMRPGMLASQLALLEEPHDAIVADIAQTPEQIVAEIRAALGLG